MVKELRRRSLTLALVLCAVSIPAVAFGRGSSAGPPVTLRGTLQIGHFDNLRTGRARHFTRLRTAMGYVTLTFQGEVPERLNGSRVRIDGVRTGGRVRVRALHVLGTTPPASTLRAFTNAGTATTVNVAVILFNFSNVGAQPWSLDDARGVVLTNPDSAAAYYDEVTAGRLSLAGDVFGWFTIPYDNSSCAPGAWADAAKAALVGSGVDVSSFDKFVLAFPYTAACQWNGIGVGSDAWVNGSLNLQTVAHELGHTFGLGHSKSMSCFADGVRVAIAADLAGCTVSEYGDPFDIMGRGSGRHANNVAKASRSWLDEASVQTVTADGTYSLGPAEVAGALPQLVRLPRMDGSWLNLEFRQPFGEYFDAFSSADPVVNGVSIRWTPANALTPQLLDATPGTLAFEDAPLGLGQTFSDPAGGVSITTVAVSATAATVEIRFSGPVDAEPPGAPTGLVAAVAGEDTIELAWSAAIDNVGVTGYRVSRDGALVASLPSTARSYSDTGRAAGSTYRYSVAALDAAGNVGPAAEVSAATPPAPDLVPPTSPTNLTATLGKGKKVRLAWSAASDDIGVAGYRVYRNARVVASVTGLSYSESLTGKAVATYVVVAVDASGNASAPSNAVTVG